MAVKLFRVLPLLLLLALPAQAQYLGQVAPQTDLQRVFTDQNGTGCSNVRNVGASSHILFYTLASGPYTGIDIRLEGSMDGVIFFPISNSAKNTVDLQGAVFASGYYAVVRGCVNSVTGTAPFDIDGWYTGTSVALSDSTGIFATSSTNVQTLFFGQVATANAMTSFSPPMGNAGGTIVFEWSTFPSGGSGFFVEVVPSTRLTTNVTGSSYLFPVAPNNVDRQTYAIPNVAADSISITYDFVAVPPDGVFNIFYISGDTAPPQAMRYNFPSQTVAGVTQGIPVSTSFRRTVFGTVMDDAGINSQYAVRDHTVFLLTAGAATDCTFHLEGSLNSADGVNGVWFDLSGPITCTSSVMFHITDKPVLWVRGNVTSLSAATSVAPRYWGIQ